MCGILGFIARNNYRNIINQNDGNKSLRYIESRGPDSINSEYIKTEKYNLFLGHTRLAIQDLSSNYNQPYKSDKIENLLVYNGEIYNYKDFFDYKNYTSDTKALYELMSNNKSNLSKFDGIFSFVFWNKNENNLYFARDRFGVKPLFLLIKNDFIAFSSSIRAIKKLCEKFFELSLNLEYLNESIEIGYTHNDSTIFKEINKLNKNTLFKLDLESWNFSNKKIYSDKLFNLKTKKNISQNSLELIIKETIKSQIITSNRGVGFFLSGGTDSSLLVSEALKLDTKSKINTFSLIVPGEDTNELKNINAFKNIFKDLKKISFKKDAFVKSKIINALIEYKSLDYPVLDISIIPSIVLCNSVDKDIRVILSGDGADELFCGYQRVYNTFWRFLVISFIPKKIKSIILKFFPKNIKLRKYLLANHPLDVRMILMNIDNINREFYLPYKKDFKSIFKTICDYELNYYLPSVLEKVDAASMLSSLEVRVPFLSNKLIDYLSKISISEFIWQNNTKFFLKKILSFRTSNSYAFMPKKGFSFNRKNQVRAVISFLESKKYPLLLGAKEEIILKRSEKKYIRLLLIKHWLFK